ACLGRHRSKEPSDSDCLRTRRHGRWAMWSDVDAVAWTSGTRRTHGIGRMIAHWIALVLVSAPAGVFADDAPKATKPNILVIVADDLGYGDIGVHGGNAVPTPNIDKLAASGVRCTSGYVSAPYCSPSRAG